MGQYEDFHACQSVERIAIYHTKWSESEMENKWKNSKWMFINKKTQEWIYMEVVPMKSVEVSS